MSDLPTREYARTYLQDTLDRWGDAGLLGRDMLTESERIVLAYADGRLIDREAIDKWYKDHCFAPDDCVVPSDGFDVSVDLSDLLALLGIGADYE